jgi:alpha-glucosidase
VWATLAGLTKRLDYIASPGVDQGYDASNYRDVGPLFGIMAEFDPLLAKAHAYNLRVLQDVMPNRCSSEHPLFKPALAAVPGSPEREMFHFVGRADGNPDRPPNNWQSVFGGPAWSRTSPPGAPHGCRATDMSQKWT